MIRKMLGAKQIHEAVEIFDLNVRMHPNSSNAYDSLGEAYAVAGDNQHALEAYRRSVELNPGNDNGVRMIQQLEKQK